MTDSLEQLTKQVKQCDLCRAHLPHGPRPVLWIGANAKVLIIGQAPGAKVHASGVPWDDASGKRLRSWMGVSEQQFYDTNNVAIMPMGFCYPGKGKSGDLPPRTECAPKWHQQVLAQLPHIQLTLLIGQYAQQYYLKDKNVSLTQRVAQWQTYFPQIAVLPHPSPRNQFWLRKNPWFETDLIPVLQQQINRYITE